MMKTKKILKTILVCSALVFGLTSAAYAGTRLMDERELKEMFGDGMSDEDTLTLKEEADPNEVVEKGTGEDGTEPVVYDQGLVTISLPYCSGLSKVFGTVVSENGTEYPFAATSLNNYRPSIAVPFGAYTVSEKAEAEFDKYTNKDAADKAVISLADAVGAMQTLVSSSEDPEIEFNTLYVSVNGKRLLNAHTEFGLVEHKLSDEEPETLEERQKGVARVMFLPDEDWAGYNITVTGECRVSDEAAYRLKADCLKQNKYIEDVQVAEGTYRILGAFVRGDETGEKYPLYTEKEEYEIKAGKTTNIYVRCGEASQKKAEPVVESTHASVKEETTPEAEKTARKEASEKASFLWIPVMAAILVIVIGVWYYRKKRSEEETND